MLRQSLFFLLLCISSSLLAQNIPMGSWRNHADYSTAQKAAEFNNKVFCATNNGLFYFDSEDGSLNTLSTTDGLSSINISMLQVIDDVLLIGYEDGLMDVMDVELNITTFEGIFRSELRGDKSINQAVAVSELVYLATDFGVVLYNIAENELIDAFLDLGVDGERISISGISTDNQKLYLSTAEGLLTGTLSENINLKDFSKWERNSINSEGTALLKTVFYKGNLYGLVDNNSIYQFQNDEWQRIFNPSIAIEQLKKVNDQLYVSAGSQLFDFAGNSFESAFLLEGASEINDFAAIKEQFFLAEENSGLLRFKQGTVESLRPQGPKGETASLHQIEQFTFHLSQNVVGFSFFENGRWEYTGEDANGQKLPIFNDVALDVSSGNGIFLSREKGLFSWNTETITPLSVGDSIVREWVSLAESPQGSYWSLIKTTNSLYGLFNPESQSIVEMNLPSSTPVYDYLIVPNGDHYLATNSGIFVFNPENVEERRLTTILGNGNLPDNQITDLALDLSGQLWIGTENGVAFFNRFQGVLLQENVDASQPIFEGFFLFDGIPVNHITIDGGNRKWMSTRDGLWLFDENIERNILHLRRSNSPIIDNDIQQMVVNPLNGELFMISSTQFLSYRTDATRAVAAHTDVEVFPNPVRLATDNTVTIRGLAFNNEVMITDVAGNLIHKGTANGGTFSWNLLNYSGFRAKSGVYLVFSINDDGTETYRTKFAILP
ncbi:Por secretion system C-terminal sorting domain-containing protein [Marivirga sericea]|uniref:Por secretion system C-terminal sorting domain-containing protein n=1 Tax=Marivirga sericea TaxID=1028 RepID=A0A1X7KTF5_9BACT|nr:T9SS type A sorting domain-containing protein [Marivirga sericea]SMG44167.1 Por secretion system C-terminal sorting domain-containing protein [Marivirga sericea]